MEYESSEKTKNRENNINEVVGFYLMVKKTLEDLEEAIEILLILICMAIWTWISITFMPLFDAIDKYIAEPLGLFVFFLILAVGWLIIIRQIKKSR